MTIGLEFQIQKIPGFWKSMTIYSKLSWLVRWPQVQVMHDIVQASGTARAGVSANPRIDPWGWFRKRRFR